MRPGRAPGVVPPTTVFPVAQRRDIVEGHLRVVAVTNRRIGRPIVIHVFVVELRSPGSSRIQPGVLLTIVRVRQPRVAVHSLA